MGDVFIAHIHAVTPQLLGGRLHVNGVPMDDGIESEAKAAQLFLLPLLKRASDFAALAVDNKGGQSQGGDPLVSAGAGAGADAPAPIDGGSGADWNDNSPPAGDTSGSGWDDNSPPASGGGNDGNF